MISSEIFDFLLPQAEPLQLGFLSLIVFMMLFTIITTRWYARDISWENKWNNGTPDNPNDDLDIDHGSIMDLWHAVATWPEKLAEIMPSLLLVVGLLGTFLGLGLALNHASNILGQSNALSAAGAADSMQQLMGMMHGLGTKFKTSTWGIMGFLLLRIWSSITQFDEKRLKWVILKVKDELEQRKVQLQKAEETKQQALLFQISQAAEVIVQGFAQNLAQLSAHQKEQHAQTLQDLKKTRQVTHDDLSNIQSAMQNDNAAMKLVLEQSTLGVREDLADINVAMRSDSVELKQTLIQTAKVTHDDLSSIQSAMKNDNTAMKLALEQSTQGIREDLADINKATQDSSQAINGFVESTKSIIQEMSVASVEMADGARQVGVAGSSLVKAVDDFSAQFTQVLGDVRTDLSTAINDMSEQAATTLEQGTAKLGEATREISAALGELSKDVNVTMDGVKDSNKESIRIQAETSAGFKSSVAILNENVVQSKTFVESLGDSVISSLGSMTEASMKVRSVGMSLVKIEQQMIDLVPALEPLKTLNTQYQPLLDETKALRVDLSKLDFRKELQSIGSAVELSVKTQLESIYHLHTSTDTLNENIASTIKQMRDLCDVISVSLESLPIQHQSLINEIQGVRQDLQVQSSESIYIESQSKINTDAQS